MSHEVSIVSAFFDIGRDSWEGRNGWLRRTTEDYLGWFNNLGRLKNQMIIFTESKFAADILQIRRMNGLESDTIVMLCDHLFAENGPVGTQVGAIRQAMRPEFRGFVQDPERPEYWNANYVLLNSLKSAFVCAAMKLGLNAHEQIAWIDFGYCRDDRRFDPSVPWCFDCGGRMNIFHIQEPDERPIFDVIRTGDVYFQGCHIVGPTTAWFQFRELIDEVMSSMLACGLIDDDQTAILMAYRRAPELFRIHSITPNDWFVVLRDFAHRAPN